MAGLQLTLTKAGRAALVNAEQDGTAPLTIASVGLTESVFAPEEDLTSLPGEFKRIDTISGETVSPDTIHVTIRDESTDSYNVHGLGYWLSNGVLLAVYGQNEPILQKSTQSMLLLSADMVLTTINTASLTFGDTNFMNPPATEERQGVVELASVTEATKGVDTVRAVTPAGVWAAIDQSRLKTSDELPEGTTNLYFGMDRVRNTLLAGLSFASGAVISAADSIVVALGKLQQQISTLITTKADATGTNAQGTWKIHITGTAAYAKSAQTAQTAQTAQSAQSAQNAQFAHSATTAAQLNLVNGGGLCQFNWAGQGGQPTWLWGGNVPNTMYVYNPANFRVSYANSSGVATHAHNGIVSITYGVSSPYRGGGGEPVCFTFLTFVFYNGATFSVATGNIRQGAWFNPQAGGIPTSGRFYL